MNRKGVYFFNVSSKKIIYIIKLEEEMNTQTKLLITALTFVGAVSTASAAGVITNIEASGPGLGSFTSEIDGRELELEKAFGSVAPITLTFTVGHANGAGNPYTVTEEITNNTGVDWTDFHFTIFEPDGGNGVVFSSFNSSTLSGFTLDSPPSSGPRELNFTGGLEAGESAVASFNLSPFDPGEGNTMTFTLVQVPTISPIPEPETYLMLLVGLGLVGFALRRRKDEMSGSSFA